MGFPGTWMTESESMVYRVVPKCACSTIGQIMFYSDHGRFFEGDIHDAKTGLHKWNQEESQGPISANVAAHRSFAFTCVRNPYTRILSSFFDKIAGIQRNGRRYRGNLVPMLVQKYGIDVGSPENGFEFDQVASFRRFLLFARDTIRWRKPMDPDIHWSAISGHVSTFIQNGGRYDHIFWTERFDEGMAAVLERTDTPVAVDLSAVPRFNESEGHGPKRAHPVGAYFDDLSMHLMWECYRRDFQLFRYDFENPDNKMPLGEIDLDEVHLKLGPKAAA
ncbi:sulfotransferase family protein [Wenxinia saemankumensis]|uniref:Sulfotransferase family protein n=1 Tax=Wenxinia saemankumensis TaxID=1447782 RepID=A0A1M6EFE5_9RHOB|nr:sulfotransferase family protein [Wenxinia saemankumensis]SHI84185.1 Sulfotransferase family protein [Wenxinia saemankumensis]